MKTKLIITVIVITVLLIVIGRLVFAEQITYFLSVFWGIIIPLVINTVTFFIVRYKKSNGQEYETRANLLSFFLRVLLYGASVAIVVTQFDIKVKPFIFSFTITFVFLTLIEALYLWRLLPREKNG